MYPDYQAFLRGVLEFPFDDSPREILADYLEEQGETVISKTIRIGFRASKLDKSDCFYESSLNQLAFEMAINYWDRPSEVERLGLGLRMPLYLPGQKIDPPLFMGLPNCNAGILDRGFLSKLSCTMGQFYENAFKIFSMHPITKVRIIDCGFVVSLRPQDRSAFVMAGFNIDKVGRVTIEVRSQDNKPTSHYEEMIFDLLVDTMRQRLGLPKIHSQKYQGETGTLWSVEIKPIQSQVSDAIVSTNKESYANPRA